MATFRLSGLNLKLGPIGGSFSPPPDAHKALNDLFVEARTRRAVFESSHGRADQPYVTESIGALRSTASSALKTLGPSAGDTELAVMQIVDACNQYLTRVKRARTAGEPTSSEFEPALRDLQAVILVVADHVGAFYDLASAKALARLMRKNDPRLTSRAKELGYPGP